jgi:hypothetical protein
VEGKIRHPPQEDPWEYTVVVYVRNERGEEVARHVINVGALANAEERVVSLVVEVMPPKPIIAVPPPKPAATTPASSPLATAKSPLVPPAPAPQVTSHPRQPPAAAAPAKPTAAAAPPGPLRPAKDTLTPPKPGDPYTSTFGRGPKPR